MTRRTASRNIRLPVTHGEILDFTPVPRQRIRSGHWSAERQHAFIEALADTGSVASACKAVDMSTVGANHLRRQPGAEEFREAWEKALDLGVQRIEDVAMDRALKGVEEPLYCYGELIGTRKRYNGRLLMFVLRNRAPERFYEGKAEALNAVGKMEAGWLKRNGGRSGRPNNAASRQRKCAPASVPRLRVCGWRLNTGASANGSVCPLKPGAHGSCTRPSKPATTNAWPPKTPPAALWKSAPK
ncbi:MAG: hypothetical protein WBA51_01210 [Erythrobacter sp.]